MDRHPNLRWGVMEMMTDWLPMLLRRLDTTRYSELSITGRNSTQLELTPSEYVQRSVRVSSFAAEKPGHTMDRVGPLLMWSADYPHAEGMSDPITYIDDLAGMSEEDQAKIMGGNLAGLMNVGVSA